ncbi:methyl-accepting chemotaxis protein [Accumulibacter sp.]|uniref:methyl-accepting chemotaxis protein n=1 Tax=Accumulibacter sp. TaxID=2053492 RepID=UPI00261C5357|nr:methyl-accepting chemotaxis protein [Accumulibacter sp.]
MANPSREMSTRNRLLVMLSLPLLALVVYSTLAVWEAIGELRSVRLSNAAIEAAIVTGQLVHEQQKERGLSGGFLASKGEQFHPELSRQRELTNQKLDGLKLVATRLGETPRLAQALLPPVEAAIDKAAALSDLRRQVDALTVKPAESFAHYTAAISAGVDVIGAVAQATNNAEIARQATAYLMFVQAKEFAGRERATLNAAFAAKTFDPESFRRFVGIVAAHDLYMRSFRTFATAEARDTVDQTVKGGIVEEVAQMSRKALESIAGEEFDVAPALWFRASTARIDLMKTVESKLDEQIRAELAKQENAALRIVILALLGSLTAVAVALLLSGATIRRLTRRLGGEPATAAALARAIASGDLTQSISLVPNDTQSVMAAMRTMQENLREMIAAVHATSGEVLSEASRLAGASSQVSAASSASSQSAQTIAAAVEQLSTSIQNISGSSNVVNSTSRETGEAAIAGREIVSRTASEMKSIAEVVEASSRSVTELGQQSEEIATIANVIREIADQTNLLALNAAIEAARAGEQGRGFAVVADEVRKLAERTRRSTLEISSTVEKIRSCMTEAEKSMAAGTTRVRDALAEAERAKRSMDDIHGSASRVISSVDDITAQLREQSSSSKEISNNVSAIATSSTQVSNTVDSMAEIAKHLESLASTLEQSVKRFQLA